MWFAGGPDFDHPCLQNFLPFDLFAYFCILLAQTQPVLFDRVSRKKRRVYEGMNLVMTSVSMPGQSVEWSMGVVPEPPT
jgi:hypothetical protein